MLQFYSQIRNQKCVSSAGQNLSVANASSVESVVQASIVIITTAAGKLQDDTKSNSLDPAVTLWLVYAFLSVAISGTLLVLSYTAKKSLPAARLSQIAPSALSAEVERLARVKGLVQDKQTKEKESDEDEGYESEGAEAKAHEKALKSPEPNASSARQWVFAASALGIIFIGWIMFGLGVGWGVHGSVVAGTVGE